MKKFNSMLVALAVMVLPVIAGNPDNIAVKWSGPSGQGNMIIWCPTTGTTNMVYGSNGVVTLNCASSLRLALTTNAILTGDGSIAGGNVLTVTNGANLLNIAAASLVAGGTLPSLVGSALTSLTPANITAGGLTGTKTNTGTGFTNLWMFRNGMCTNVTFTGP